MKTESICIAFCLIFVPACKGQRSETPKWVVDGRGPSTGSYISEAEYAAGTTLNFQVQNTGKLSAIVICRVPPDHPKDNARAPSNWIAALGPKGPQFSVQFKGTSNVLVTLRQSSRLLIYGWAHLSAQENPIGPQETDGYILDGDSAPATSGGTTTFNWKYGVSVTMSIASSASSNTSPGSDTARIAELENELKKLKRSQGSAPSTAGALTREVAAKLVAPSYPRSLGRVCFSDQGLQRAQADGLLVSKTVMTIMTVYEFTEKAKQLLGPQIPQSISRDERGQLCLSISALTEQFEAITGVAIGPLPNTASIEYTTRYMSSSPILDKLRPYIYTGNKQSADAQLYDDGWRLGR